MSEPWVNFSDKSEKLDVAIFLRPDLLERVHIYLRPSGSFGIRNYFRTNSDLADSWGVGPVWGHHYDSIATAIKEAIGKFSWVGGVISETAQS
jgi:hypothetical protein